MSLRTITSSPSGVRGGVVMLGGGGSVAHRSAGGREAVVLAVKAAVTVERSEQFVVLQAVLVPPCNSSRPPICDALSAS